MNTSFNINKVPGKSFYLLFYLLLSVLRRRIRGTSDPGQPLHGAQYSRSRPAVGPARPALDAHAAQPRAADTGQKPFR